MFAGVAIVRNADGTNRCMLHAQILILIHVGHCRQLKRITLSESLSCNCRNNKKQKKSSVRYLF